MRRHPARCAAHFSYRRHVRSYGVAWCRISTLCSVYTPRWYFTQNMTAKIDEILLIEMVREYECLYNTNSKHYRDQNMRGEAWEVIAREIGTTGE